MISMVKLSLSTSVISYQFTQHHPLLNFPPPHHQLHSDHLMQLEQICKQDFHPIWPGCIGIAYHCTAVPQCVLVHTIVVLKVQIDAVHLHLH